jgi:hypothetical protein
MPLSLGRSVNVDIASDIAMTDAESSAMWTWTATDDWNVNGLMTLQNHAALELLEPLEESPDEEQGFPEIHRKLQKCVELMDGANSQLAMAEKVRRSFQIPPHQQIDGAVSCSPHSPERDPVYHLDLVAGHAMHTVLRGHSQS